MVYGFNEGEQDNSNLWDVLEHRILTSDIPFCNKPTSINSCNQTSVGTFSFPNQNPNKGYRYIYQMDSIKIIN